MLLLRVDGLAYSGFVAGEFSRSLEALASGFSLVLTDSPSAQALLVARPGSLCEIELDGRTFLTGFVETFAVDTSPTNYTLTASGRSLTADLVDSDIIAPMRFNGHSLLQVATALGALHGLAVDVDAEAAGACAMPLGRIVARYGDSQREVLERACRLAGVQATDTAGGSIRLTIGGKIGGPGALRMGHNVLASTVTADAADIFARYSCRSQIALPDADDVGTWGQMAADIVEPLGARNRTLAVSPEQGMDRAGCLARVEFEAATRAGRALTASVELAGWQPYRCGDLVRYTDDAAGFDGELVIAETTYRVGPGEMRTNLLLRPAGAYLAVPPARRKRQPGGGSRYWKDLETYSATVGR